MTIIKQGKTAEELYNEYKGQKCIRNGVYCKKVLGTYEAFNTIPPVVEYTEEELKEMENGYDS